MKKAILSVENLDTKTKIEPFSGMIEDEAIRIIYHEDNGAVNVVEFNEVDKLKIKRFLPGFKSNIYLSKDECYAKIHTDEGELEVPIELKDILYENDTIRARYYTGENFEILIRFFKE